MTGKNRKKDGEGGILVQNRKARHLYDIIESFEAGIELKGCEVKSLRDGKGSVAEAYIIPRNGELWVTGMHITPYEKVGAAFQENPVRERRLLLHRREIHQLIGGVSAKGMTIVPLSVYLNERGLVKMKIGLARGKAAHDKRQDIRERDTARELAREYRL